MPGVSTSSDSPGVDLSAARPVVEFLAVVGTLVLAGWAVGALFDNLTLTRAPISAAAVMVVVPALAAVVVARRHGAWTELRRRVRLSAGLPQGWPWWVVAVIGVVLAMAVEGLVDGRPLLDRVAPAQVAGLTVLFLVAAVAEEVGWTSFLLPRLLARYRWPVAAVLLGLMWAAIHVVPWHQGGHPWSWVAGQALATVLARLFLVQMTCRSGNWLWPAVLGHATSNVLWAVSPLAGARFNPWVYSVALAVLVGLGAAWRHRPRLVTAVSAVTAVLVLAAAAALAVGLPSYRFPRPTGPFGVGTVVYQWTDAGREDILAPTPGTPRQVVAQLWYPARPAPGAATVPYLPDPDAIIEGAGMALHLPVTLPLAGLRRVVTNTVAGASVATDAGPLPVLVFVSGLAGFRQSNTFQAEELASHGYVVVTLDLPYASAATVHPDGRVTPYFQPADDLRALVGASYQPDLPLPTLRGRTVEPDTVLEFLGRDVSFVLDRLADLDARDARGVDAGLAGRLDLSRTGIFGVSLGGIVVGQACAVEPRLRACLSLEGPMPHAATTRGLTQPTMIISRSADSMRAERRRAGGWSEGEIAAHHTSYRQVVDRLPGDGWFLQIDAMSHVDFTDAPWGGRALRWAGMTGPMDSERAHAVVNAYTLAFFERTLRGRPAPLLDGSSPAYPEVRMDRRR